MLEKMEYYGSTVLGEKGQVVVPAKIRKKFGLGPGDKFLVLTGKKMGAWGIVLVKADVLSKVVEKMFGGDLRDIFIENAKEKK
jgi:AbrB family looped-hinge helix DNA binding protein